MLRDLLLLDSLVDGDIKSLMPNPILVSHIKLYKFIKHGLIDPMKTTNYVLQVLPTLSLNHCSEALYFDFMLRSKLALN